MSSAQPVAPDKNSPPAAQPAGPCVMVIFGATGDLTKRLLMPSLYNLTRQNLLPQNFAIVGFALPDIGGDGGFRDSIRADLKEFGCDASDDPAMNWLTERLYYSSASFDDAKAYQQLKSRLDEIDGRHATGGNYLFYFAIAPEFFLEVPRQLSGAGLLEQNDGRWRRIVIENLATIWKARASSIGIWPKYSTKVRSTGLIIIWVKKPCRTLSCSGSRTEFSNRCGTAGTSITFKSLSLKP